MPPTCILKGSKRMKRIIGIILTVTGIVTAAISLIFKGKGLVSAARSVSVIGADGPTSIFLTGKISDAPAVGGIIIGTMVCVVGIFMTVKNKA